MNVFFPPGMCWLHDSGLMHYIGVWIVDAVKIFAAIQCDCRVEPAEILNVSKKSCWLASEENDSPRLSSMLKHPIGASHDDSPLFAFGILATQ